jgi:hypothetical protein
MMNIQLQTGKTINISAYEYYFILKDEEVDFFFQSCVADDLGTEINNPFANRASAGKLDLDDLPDIPDLDDLPDIDMNSL